MLETILKPMVDYFMSLGCSGMALVSYLEAIFLPLPPDVLLFACSLCKPHDAILYAVVAGVSSGLGAATNYWIGLKGGRRLFHAIFKNQQEQLDKIEKMYKKYGVLTVFIIAFTPIPFMIFTMASGIFELSFIPYFIACTVGRTARFLINVSLVMAFGTAIKHNIEMVSLLAAVLICVVVILHFPKKNPENQ